MLTRISPDGYLLRLTALEVKEMAVRMGGVNVGAQLGGTITLAGVAGLSNPKMPGAAGMSTDSNKCPGKWLPKAGRVIVPKRIISDMHRCR